MRENEVCRSHLRLHLWQVADVADEVVFNDRVGWQNSFVSLADTDDPGALVKAIADEARQAVRARWLRDLREVALPVDAIVHLDSSQVLVVQIRTHERKVHSDLAPLGGLILLLHDILLDDNRACTLRS